MKLISINIENFKGFRAANLSHISPHMSVLTGVNGCGKSSLFDAFLFLQDCLTVGAKKAVRKRRGFRHLSFQNGGGDIEIILKLTDETNSLPFITYRVVIAGKVDSGDDAICVSSELLYRTSSSGKRIALLDFQNGEGEVLLNERARSRGAVPCCENKTLAKRDSLSLSSFGQFANMETATSVLNFIKGWRWYDIQPSLISAQHFEYVKSSDVLDWQGSNLQEVLFNMAQQDPESFRMVVAKFYACVATVGKVQFYEAADGAVSLSFQYAGAPYEVPTCAVPHSFLRILTYLTMLHQANPPTVIFVENPEYQVYADNVGWLINEFREYAKRGGQVILSTHSSDVSKVLLDGELRHMPLLVAW